MKNTLIIIPAYNEEDNIEKVLKELNKDLKGVDILVINDCSKDRTKIIVEKNGIKCITLPFNMGYSRAIQTGIKYANDYNYDYVVQFDADGQHIAKEAQKLLDKIQKDECDIVIGSRYLEENNYNQSFFRKIGTIIFSKLIKLFCKKNITDPLSGFQCLNKRVIERFSKLGMYPDYPDANLIIELLYDNYKIEEVSVKMRLREFGESMHGGIIKPIKYMIQMFYTIFIIILRNIFKRRRK